MLRQTDGEVSAGHAGDVGVELCVLAANLDGLADKIHRLWAKEKRDCAGSVAGFQVHSIQSVVVSENGKSLSRTVISTVAALMLRSGKLLRRSPGAS